MIPRQETATSQVMEPTEGRITPAIDILTRLCVFCKCDEFKNGSISRQIDILCPLLRVAAPVHGDFIPQVGRAYRMSATERPKQAFQTLRRTSVRKTRTGFEGDCCLPSRTRQTMRCQVLQKRLEEQNISTEALRGRPLGGAFSWKRGLNDAATDSR
jgi:hypothetical protein